jgi:aryl-alcohol dehydrogenase-like predicted oxidoreductase
MQHVLQSGLSAGMSATEGVNTAIHQKKPNPVPPEFDGLASVMPLHWKPTSETRVTYRGKIRDVHAPPIIVGAWSWGDKATWHWDPSEEPAVAESWKICLRNGVNFIDTAQAYGTGESERICGRLFKGMKRNDFIIQTKYYVVPQTTDILHPTSSPEIKLKGSLENLGLDYIDIYLVHGPIHLQSIATVAKGMAKCVDEGLTKCVGVANYGEKDMLKMEEELAKYGVPLALNQCEFSVLRRLPETSGLLRTCRNRGIVFQSYSSLAQGRLTGKYNSRNPPPKEYRFSSYKMEDIEPSVEVLETIAHKHHTSASAVALNYNMCKGISPLVGMRRPEQAEANCEALGWRLSNEEIRHIDAVSFEGYETSLWQHG